MFTIYIYQIDHSDKKKKKYNQNNEITMRQKKYNLNPIHVHNLHSLQMIIF